MAMQFFYNNDVENEGELIDDEDFNGEFLEEWNKQTISEVELTDFERKDENQAHEMSDELNACAQKYFQLDHKDLTPQQQNMCKIHCELSYLEASVEKSLPTPTDSVFFTSLMVTKLDDVFQTFSNDMVKLRIDTQHKPIYWDLTPDHRLLKNGKLVKQFFPMEDGNLPQETIAKYQGYKTDESDSTRNYIYEVFHDETHSRAALIVYIVIVTSIIASVITTMLSTVPSLEKHETVFNVCETIVTLCFTTEYVIKLVIVRNRVGYALRVMNVLDLLAILPFYLGLVLGDKAAAIAPIGGVLRALRLTRIAKIRQLATPYTNIIMRAMVDALKGTGSAVGIFLFIGTVMTGTLVYAAEKDYQCDTWPDCNSFESIPIGMWYAMVTITTVGYGDYYPQTTVGLLLGTVCILSGLILTSLIIMVIGQYYMIHLEEYEKKKEQIKKFLYESADDHEDGTELSVDERLESFSYLLNHYKSGVMYAMIKDRMRQWEEAKNQSQVQFPTKNKKMKMDGEQANTRGGGKKRGQRARGCSIM